MKALRPSPRAWLALGTTYWVILLALTAASFGFTALPAHAELVAVEAVGLPIAVGITVMLRRRYALLAESLAFRDGADRPPEPRLLHGRLEAALARSVRQRHLVAVLFLDFDRFKLVNDSLGVPTMVVALQRRRTELAKLLPTTLREYIDAAPVCRIATVRAGGEPHIIPVCPVFDGERTVYVDLGPKSTTGRALGNERRATVLIDDYFDDWSKLRKVILRCDAEPVTGAEQEAAWVRIRVKFPQYKAIDWTPRLTVALRIREWIAEGFGEAK